MTFFRTLACMLAATGMLPLLASPLPQRPAFRSSLDIVRVEALVTDGSRVVKGLRAEDFELRDDGVPQKVNLIRVVELPVNVVLVLDVSDSVHGERLAQLQAASRRLIDGLAVGDRVSLITFSHVVRVGPLLSQDFRAVWEAILRIRPEGGTALYDAAQTGIIVSSGADAGRGLVVLFSDGRDTSSFLPSGAVFDAARRGDVVLYGVVSGGNRKFLSRLADETGGEVFSAGSLERLPEYFARILEEFRQRYVLGYTPSGVRKGGWHRIDVRIKGRRLTVRARPGYQADRSNSNTAADRSSQQPSAGSIRPRSRD